MLTQSELKEYSVNVSPEHILRYLNTHTETYQLVSNLSIERNWKVTLWSQIDGSSFRIRQKSRARGYTNSYSPWLCGDILATEQGSCIRTWFEIDHAVQINEIISYVVLIIFTVIIGIVTIVNLFSAAFQPTFLVALAMVVILWAGTLWMKQYGMTLAQKDQRTLTAFIHTMVATLSQ